jgi:hypothetical protein
LSWRGERAVTNECPAVQGECGLRRSHCFSPEGHPRDASFSRSFGDVSQLR